MDWIRNAEMREMLGQEAVVSMVQRRQNRWKDKLAEMDNERLVKKVNEDEVEG